MRNNVRRAALTALIGILSFVFSPAAQGATSRMHGVVMGVDQANGTVLIRHDAFDGMPAMTMPFRFPSDAAAPVVGEEVRADVDTAHEPWRLEHVQRIAPELAAQPAPIATPLPIGSAVGAVPLIDERGAPYDVSRQRSHAQVVSFIYTRCPDPSMCPLISTKFAALQRLAGPSVRLVEVTLDPEYDTPRVLAAYAKRVGADPAKWSLLTGAPAAVAAFASDMGVTTLGRPTPSSIIHTEALVLIDRNGLLAARYDGNEWQPAEIARAADALGAVPPNAAAALLHQPALPGRLTWLVVLLLVLLAGVTIRLLPQRGARSGS